MTSKKSNSKAQTRRSDRFKDSERKLQELCVYNAVKYIPPLENEAKRETWQRRQKLEELCKLSKTKHTVADQQDKGHQTNDGVCKRTDQIKTLQENAQSIEKKEEKMIRKMVSTDVPSSGK